MQWWPDSVFEAKPLPTQPSGVVLIRNEWLAVGCARCVRVPPHHAGSITSLRTSVFARRSCTHATFRRRGPRRGANRQPQAAAKKQPAARRSPCTCGQSAAGLLRRTARQRRERGEAYGLRTLNVCVMNSFRWRMSSMITTSCDAAQRGGEENELGGSEPGAGNERQSRRLVWRAGWISYR